MIFGDPKDFAIEAYHEPSGPKWGGFGRICIHIQGTQLGDVRDNHCSLFHATDRFRELAVLPRDRKTIEALWDQAFENLSDREIFDVIDRECYKGESFESMIDLAPMDFLTNTGEMFDGTKTFIVCRQSGVVHILYRFRDNSLGSGTCSVRTFRKVAEEYVRWFDEQVRKTGPPFFPLNPFDLNEKAPDNQDS